MPRRQQRLTVISVPTLRHRLLFDVYHSTQRILTFDPATLSLATYHWPVEEKKRVTPDALRNYRDSHQFLGPCCLCPLIVGPLREDDKPCFVEAAIYMPVSGRYAGEYIAECAKSRCGYLVPLERLYCKPGVPVKICPPRDSDVVCPPPCLHLSEIDAEAKPPRPLKRTYAQADLADAPALGVDLDYETDWRKVAKLDSLDRPGLTEVEFFGLFVKCDVCKLVMTRQVFRNHYCSVGEDGLVLTDQE